MRANWLSLCRSCQFVSGFVRTNEGTDELSFHFFSQRIGMEAWPVRKVLRVLHDWTQPFHTFPDSEFVGTVGLLCVILGLRRLTSSPSHAFHVRLIATLESRVHHIADYFKPSEKEAAEYLETDRSRKQYVRRSFSVDIPDVPSGRVKLRINEP